MSKINSRKCPICGSKEKAILISQKFSNDLVHDISSCKKCRFVFVGNTPSQNFYNQYYKNMSKYEIERDHVLHEEYFAIFKKYINSNSKILDIGCSTGHLLYLLKKEGYMNLDGIDPSPLCKKIAIEKFNIQIITTDIASFKPKKKYDLIIYSMVFEHLENIKEAVSKARTYLSDDGYLFVSVPDAENFYNDFEEPFGEFSTEHINFFSTHYLFKLMSNFSCVFMETDNKNIYSVWKNSDLSKSIKKYIKVSNSKMKNIKNVINSCPQKVIVWGAGSLTQRLLNTTNLRKKVLKYVDSDEKLNGKMLGDIEIISPDNLIKYSEPILISSFRFKEEIIEVIKKMKLTNKIITFY